MVTDSLRFLTIVLLAGMSLFAASQNARAADEIPIKSGQKLAFLGDSITAQGAATPSGYVQLVISGFKANGIEVTPIPAGISGHTSRDMIARIDRDVIEKKPDWMTLSCGVNDVWHGPAGVALAAYQKNITEMVDRAQKAGIKVMLLTSTMIGEDQNNPNNQKLIPYNEFLRDLAKQKDCLLADLNADMQAAVLAAGGGKPGMPNTVSIDGVHMIPSGNMMMATGILKAFGLNDAQLEKAREAWLDIPHAVELVAKDAITIRQWDKIDVIALKEHRSVGDVVNEAFRKTVDSVIAGADQSGDAK